jgi:outer membrane protein assembly factor BamB
MDEYEQPSQSQAADRPTRKRLPWGRYFVFTVVTVFVAWAVMLHVAPGVDEARQNAFSFMLAATAVSLFYVWLVFHLVEFGWGRLAALAIPAVALTTLLVCFEIVGVSGWLIPAFAWRWAPAPDERLEVPDIVNAPDDIGDLVDLATETPADFPQFLGPERSCAVEGVSLEQDWQANPPEEVWRQEIGAGWSAFAVRNGFAVTMEQRGPNEMVTCYEVTTGKLRWAQSIENRYQTVMGGVGPRSTPTIHKGRVFTLGAGGRLQCLDGANGRVMWHTNVPADVGMSAAENSAAIMYGRSNSPLVVDDPLLGDGMVVVAGGGPPNGDKFSLCAYNIDSGELIWRGGDRQAAYSSATLATLRGVPQILTVNENSISGHAVDTGKTLWEIPWPGSSSMNANVSQVVPVDDQQIFISNGYNNGSGLVKIARASDGWTTDDVWRDETLMRTRYTNVTIRDGYVYGLSDGILQCLDLRTGEEQWKRGRFGHGQILRIGDKILVQHEYKYLSLVAASPDRFQILGRIPSMKGKSWNNLALAGECLLLRNAEEAVCFRVKFANTNTQGE